MSVPAVSNGRSLVAQPGRFPLAAVLTAMVLALVLQAIIARVYTGLIVEAFGGNSTSHLSSPSAIALSYFITALTSAACALYCAKTRGPSRIVLAVHLVAVVIPVQALIGANFEMAQPWFAALIGCAFLVAVCLAGTLPDIRLPAVSRSARLVAIVLLVLTTLYVYGALLTHGGLGRINLDLTLVYEVREEFLEDAAPFAGYLIPWQGYVLNPVLLLVGFRRRSWVLIFIGLALQILLFSMTGFRAFLLSPAMMLALYAVALRRQLASMAILGALGVIAIGGGLYAWLDEALIPSLMIYRLLIVPAEIHYWYYDFFAVRGQPTLELSQSILSAVTTQHYPAPIAEVIGWAYMGSAVSANVGLFGDAFANFGVAGCIAFALLFGLVLKAVDAAGRNTDPRIAAALVGVPAFQLVNTGLLTTLATHGLALTIIALWVVSGSKLPGGSAPRSAV